MLYFALWVLLLCVHLRFVYRFGAEVLHTYPAEDASPEERHAYFGYVAGGLLLVAVSITLLNALSSLIEG